MKRLVSTKHFPRSPFSIGLCILGALLVALSAWQGSAAIRNSARSSIGVKPVSYAAPNFEMRAIESLRPGDHVLAFDPETGERTWKRIDHAFKRVTDHLRILTIRSEDDGVEQTIKTTDEHPFWVPGQEWKAAGDLSPGDTLVTTDGLAATVVATRREEHSDTLTVFNLNIRDFHTYYVAEDYQSVAVLVHNANAEDCAKLAKAGKEAAEALAKNTDNAADAAKVVQNVVTKTAPVVSRIKESSKLVNGAEAAGRSAQASLDRLVTQLSRGNLNPGLGSKSIGNGISEARARDGARVYFRTLADGTIEILGKSTKNDQAKIIKEVLNTFGG